jgi:hypothetical protein
LGWPLGVRLDAKGVVRADAGRVDDRTVVIGLELHLSGDSLTGRATGGTGEVRDFAGWLGLVAAIDALAFDTKDTETK